METGTQSIISIGIAMIIGVILGSVGTTILLRGSGKYTLEMLKNQYNASLEAMKSQNNIAVELMKSQSFTAIEASKNAMMENSSKNSRNEREDFLNLAKSQIAPIVDPIQKSLDELRLYVANIDKDNIGRYSSITTGIEQMLNQSKALGEATSLVSHKTDALVGALRGSQARGRWGEVQLRNIVENAGMTSWSDFHEQSSAATNGEGRPDMTVRIPGGKCIFVDSKVPMSAYLDAQETSDEYQSQVLRKDHAKAVKAHVDELARRGYHNNVNSMPYTIMFLPAEPLLLSAMAETPDLWEYAMSKSILICSPMGLLPLLRVFALGWREQQQEERAAEIAQMGAELYKRLNKFVGIFNNIGSTLATLNTRYNEAAGSMTARLLPQAKRVHEAAALADTEIIEPVMIDAAPRQLILMDNEQN